MTNTLHHIVAFRSPAGIWTFSDLSRGLNNEPFVGETNAVIDRLAGGAKRVELLFSDTRFPGAECFVLEVGDMGGVWYRDGYDVRCWLCAALFRYFDEAPDELWAKAEGGGR